MAFDVAMLWWLAIPMVILATLIAVGNIRGCIWAAHNRKAGIDKGYSSIPLVSFLLCGFAFVLSKDTLGLLIFIPALIDPGTLSALCLPWALVGEIFKTYFRKP